MSNQATLTIEARGKLSKGQKKDLRKAGLVPASVDRKGEESLACTVRRDELQRALAGYGVTGIYKLQMGRKKPITAMLREVQSAPLTREWLHVTFQQVLMTEETKVDLPIVLQGLDTLQYNGFEYTQARDSLQVRGLPGDFPPAIEVDISAMQAGENLTVGELPLPEGVETDVEPDLLVLSVSHPRVREEDVEEAASEEGVETVEEPATEE
ncbi:MAG: 50S ribosomal protein L25 [Clostridiales bacterium]|nr:50S ribosomal protein L25 [Clostridiales bacterium]